MNMNRRLNILISMSTSEYSERMKLEGILQYAYEKKGVRWNLELDLSGIMTQLSKGKRSSRYDGIIAYVDSEKKRKTLLSIRLPMVLIEDLEVPQSFSRRRDVVTFFCDHEAEGQTAANYFLERHYPHFAYVGDLEASNYGAQRQAGFSEAIRAAGHEVHIAPRSARLEKWLKTLPLPCAVFAVHDLRARQVLAAAEEADIAVPADLAVLGIDDDPTLCKTSSPMLSSIPTFDRSLGYAASRALNEILLGRARGRVIRTRHTQVVTRHSTDADRMSDPHVSRAIEWARNHLDGKLTADVLARHVGCSKHYLQDRVEQEFGISLGKKIRHLKLAAATSLLANTDLTIGEIASRCGFACTSYLAVLMKKVHGTTPLNYRKRTRDFRT